MFRPSLAYHIIANVGDASVVATAAIIAKTSSIRLDLTGTN